MTIQLLATELGEFIVTESGLQIQVDSAIILDGLLAAENDDLLLTEDGYYIGIESAGLLRPVLFIANVGRMMGR